MATKNTILKMNAADFPAPVLMAWRAFDHANRAKMHVASTKTAKLPEDKRMRLNNQMRFAEMKTLASLESACEIFGLDPETACLRLDQIKPRAL